MKSALPSLRVQQPDSIFSEGGNSRWTNKDLDPVPAHERKWGVTSFVAYWISDAFNSATWQFAASVIAIGLSWRESLGVVALGFFIVSIVIALNGATGVIHHCSFPVLARASWGFWGSYIAIISRAILAVFWFAIQTMNGANTVRVMLGAIWPSFLTLKNTIPADQGITTNTMISFVLFWLAQLPFLYIHPNKVRWLFMFKSVVSPIAFIGLMIWAFVSTDSLDIFSQRATISGPAYSWAFLSSLTSVIGNYATLSVNQADFSRYSRVSVKWQLLYVPMLPIVFTFISFCGVAATNAGQVKYGTLDWDPMALVSHFPNRAVRFFVAFAFAVASLGVNISANSLSAANDLAALFPSYVNIRRGQLICALLAWALVPWKILISAGTFLNFMSAYSIFLGPIAAIMVWDFWYIHGRKYDTVALFQPYGIYSYGHGINWRALVAFLIGIAPNMPGFINSINSDIEVGVGVHPYQFGWLLGFVATSLVYVGLETVFPPRDTFIEKAVLPDELYERSGYGADAEGSEEERPGSTEKRGGFKAWADRML
ncbi:NCS1 allantoate transporter [Pseudovirgaria hyperparasitica]|uniref:NCS1 allantoate transporter n=1 Tax=Pseudovirgaria hyperparasitica TaxID=470096 RepID=A0A6A6VYN3_9PEZI|nr:NCS1 allantoate transporter [Pseudovirgaria hyperparasitica]KAF2754844.1 NCS1 allantoate transporter [Pseudovirgaria hyperparasitica]